MMIKIKLRGLFSNNPIILDYLFQCLDSITVMEYIKPNTAHMALQIPQYFFITAGEVMFSVTGLEFSYSQVTQHIISDFDLRE